MKTYFFSLVNRNCNKVVDFLEGDAKRKMDLVGLVTSPPSTLS